MNIMEMDGGVLNWRFSGGHEFEIEDFGRPGVGGYSCDLEDGLDGV